ncbi:ParB/RepB/Spo0J family partition protein [Luteimicrobium sp. DT211]|uniref:ParB/RepB/Spo0J family partition protein n=1 Tax=Luteimicrobium sp. DT211 TaxID=3393412 RepID=UPI003CF487D6
MKERRRGLGRGLGALIPTSSEGERPVDVFFPASPTAGAQETSVATIDRPEEAPTADAPVPDVSRETATDSVDEETTPTSPAEAVAESSDPDEGAQAGPGDTDVPGEPTTSSPAADGPAEPTTEYVATGGPAATEDEVRPDAAPEASGNADAGIAERDGSVGAAGRAEASDEAEIAEPTAEQEAVHAPTEPRSSSADSAGDSDDGLVPVPGASFAELPVASIRPNPRQPRTVFDEGELDELVGSIKEIGVLQPVVVRPQPDEPGHYELIMGERRWRATQAAGLDSIPAIIRVTDDEDLLRDALLENLHRSALNPLEEAAAYRQLLDDFGCTHDELALRISRSRPQISNTLRLLRLPPLVQRRVAAGVLSAGHARALLGLSDGAAIERLAQRIVSEGLSVRATEEIVALGVGDEKPAAHRPRAGQRSEAVDALASRLSDRFETRVKVDLGKSKGRVTIEFGSVEDLNRILDVMAPEDPGLLRN